MTATDTERAAEPRPLGAVPEAIARLKHAAPWLLPTAVTLLAAWLLFNRISEPARIIFDEVYYVDDARSFLALGGVEDSFAVHPPVGKWMIASTIKLFGDTSLGWRMAGVLAGTAMVLLTYLLALRLLRTRWQATVAALLLALDGLFIVQARTSMLDIFLAFFGVLGALLLVRDLQDLDRRGRTASGLVQRGLANRWLAGAAFGLAIATKWSGALALATALILVVAFEVFAHRRIHHKGIGLGRLLWVVVGPLILLPTATYLTTYVPWLVSYEHTTEGREDCPGAAEGTATCEVGVGRRLHGLWREHGDIYRFHRDLESTHGYRAEPWTFPVLGRPVAYYYETCKPDRAADKGPCMVPEGTAAEILALGNPALWWGLLALLPLVTAAMGRRDPSAWILGGFYGALFLPWMVVNRPAFLFYMVPAIAFMAIAVTLALGQLRRQPRDAVPWLAGGGAGLVAALAARLTGAETVPTAIAFGIGWTIAPLVVTFAMDRFRRGSSIEPAPDEPAPDDPAPNEPVWHGRAGGAAEPTVQPWWPSRVAGPAGSAVPAVVVTTVLLVLAIGLFVYFLPVWTGVPMEPDAIRSRWWFSSWV